jgi:hypothetical protein
MICALSKLLRGDQIPPQIRVQGVDVLIQFLQCRIEQLTDQAQGMDRLPSVPLG